MVNEQMLRGNWHEVRGKIRSRWGQIHEDDMQTFSGDVEQLVGEIQRRTGESQEAIRDYLDQITREGGATASRMTDQAGAYVSQAAAVLQDASRQVADRFTSGYGEAERLIQQRPAESLATAFGLGLVTGLLIGMLARSR